MAGMIKAISPKVIPSGIFGTPLASTTAYLSLDPCIMMNVVSEPIQAPAMSEGIVLGQIKGGGGDGDRTQVSEHAIEIDTARVADEGHHRFRELANYNLRPTSFHALCGDEAVPARFTHLSLSRKLRSQ